MSSDGGEGDKAGIPPTTSISQGAQVRGPRAIDVLSDDDLMGIRKNDPRTLKPLKVRLPLGHVLQLHRMRIVGDQTVSQIVTSALQDYLDSLQKSDQQKEA